MMRRAGGRILSIMLDRAGPVPLHRQVFADLRQSILAGRLKAGMALPSSRSLSDDLRVSRSTVVLAYEQLRAEGYIVSRPGAGTVVANTVSETTRPAERAGSRVIPRAAISPPTHAAAVRRLLTPDAQPPRAFRSGVPALDAFPIDAWTRAVGGALRKMSASHFSYGAPFGLLALREAVAEYLTAARGVRCSPEQVMILNGSQQAVSLCASALLERGASAWVEDPFYPGARGAFELAGARIVGVPVDEEGIDVAEGIRQAPEARLVYVTPSRQLPLGVTMTLRRRLDLLEWAHRAGAWIIEDDYDSEFRFTSPPLTALQGLDTHGCVIYTGTFSKVMFPSMRLGYMVVPDALRELMLVTRHFADMHSPYLEQAAMARFISDGHFERHVRRMRTLYRERQEILVRAAAQHLGGRVRVPPTSGGMTLIGWLPPGDDDVAIAKAICAAGVEVLPLSSLSVRPDFPPGLRLGYSGVRPVEIREGVRELAAALDRYDRSSRPKRNASAATNLAAQTSSS